MIKIIFATGNQGKMKEIRMIMEDLGLEIVSMKEADINVDIEENGKTFEENAFNEFIQKVEEIEKNNPFPTKTTKKRNEEKGKSKNKKRKGKKRTPRT